MRKNNGITMVSLIIYVIAMTIVMGVMSSIITTFYNNTEVAQGNVEEIIEFNKFNTYFIKEVKTTNNSVDHVSEGNNYILFSSGNSFSIYADSIYYNNIKICDNVKNIQFILEKDEEDIEEEYTIVNVTLSFENFSKSIRYKLENIY